MHNQSQKMLSTDYDYKVGELVQELVDEGYIEIHVHCDTDLFGSWYVLGKKLADEKE